MRTLFSIGAAGDTIRAIQTTLTNAGYPVGKVDGNFGDATAAALNQFQGKNQLSNTGFVDEATWQKLMDQPIPTVAERCLQLTACFEGHGFGLAVGNFDGALLTWGIIGFTLSSGNITAMVRSIHTAFPEKITQAFGNYADELLQLVNGGPEFQKSWADAHTVGGRALASPWKEMFAAFGAIPEVQQEQIKRVHSNYLEPAIATCGKLGFSSELGLALCFDIHVQNGGIKPNTMEALLPQVKSVQESKGRELVANAVAGSARPQYQEDVRSRKLTIATGTGSVHGRQFKLESWGLSGEFTAPELSANAAAGGSNA
jgi:Putative peptidoglycan binding domain/Glycosyl hydrolase family 46